jgi:hypothetical protein
LCQALAAGGFVFEDHSFEQGFNDAPFFFGKTGDGLELQFEIVRRRAFRFVEQ